MDIMSLARDRVGRSFGRLVPPLEVARGTREELPGRVGIRPSSAAIKRAALGPATVVTALERHEMRTWPSS